MKLEFNYEKSIQLCIFAKHTPSLLYSGEGVVDIVDDLPVGCHLSTGLHHHPSLLVNIINPLGRDVHSEVGPTVMGLG